MTNTQRMTEVLRLAKALEREAKKSLEKGLTRTEVYNSLLAATQENAVPPHVQKNTEKGAS